MVTAQGRLVEMKPLNVIVVEDSEDDLILIVRALKKVGYDLCCTWVETAAGLKEALADAKWQLVLSDHSMPSFSAPEALETLKESGRSLPFIIVSGTIDEKLASTIMESGAGDYVEKGNLSKLGLAVERLLGS
jgi:DNA-binding NtrC family response regulator